jgi:hypothetical protein
MAILEKVRKNSLKILVFSVNVILLALAFFIMRHNDQERLSNQSDGNAGGDSQPSLEEGEAEPASEESVQAAPQDEIAPEENVIQPPVSVPNQPSTVPAPAPPEPIAKPEKSTNSSSRSTRTS